jgi:hypothetical protein
VGQEFSHYGFLHLGIEMTDENITLNCLIIPIGKLMNIPCIKVMQAITIRKHEGYAKLEAVIQSRLGAPFNNIPLKICIIQAGSVIEKEMAPLECVIGLWRSNFKENSSDNFSF